jgi:hypothetical protein
MQVSATIQAKRDEREARPSRIIVETLADELRRRGFEVLREGRFGVSVRADETAFQQTFGFDPSSSSDPTHKIISGELRRLADAVEVAVPPTPFI